MWGEEYHFKMPDRLRAQQRALRQPRRARPLDTRMTIDRRIQQEARRKGISPQALFQQREFLKKQAKEVTEQLKKSKTPAQAQASIRKVPSQIGRLVNAREILDKVKREYNKQFDSKIQELEAQRKRVGDRATDYRRSRGRPSRAIEADYDRLGAEIRTLRGHRDRGEVLFSDALQHAKAVGSAERRKTSAIVSHQIRVQRAQEAAREAARAPTPKVTKEEVTTPFQLDQRLLQAGEPLKFDPPKADIPFAKESARIRKGLKNIFGFG